VRVLITGLGGELGTRLAQLLEARDDVTEIAGTDLDPPRRRLRRSEFHLIDPRDRDRLVDFVTDFAPSAVAHYGVYEPDSRVGARDARELTEASTTAVLGAATRTGKLEQVVVRSALEVYGRGRGHPLVPDEDVTPAPTTPWGRSCLDVETAAVALGRHHDVPVAALRFAPIVGSHVPSPLGRLLRLPAVPVPVMGDPAFCVLHQIDAAVAMAEALVRAHDGPLNVVGPGAASPWQAVRLGGRVPVPIAGPAWEVARRVCELAGAPVPEHVLELLRHGRAGDGSRAVDALDLHDLRGAQDVLAELFEWATVTPLVPASEDVA
jgi:UDP-glucose 4-epimerase